jgi:hypothetical protein
MEHEARVAGGGVSQTLHLDRIRQCAKLTIAIAATSKRLVKYPTVYFFLGLGLGLGPDYRSFSSRTMFDPCMFLFMYDLCFSVEKPYELLQKKIIVQTLGIYCGRLIATPKKLFKEYFKRVSG